MELPDELQPLIEISDQDWALIEHLAHLAGQGYTEAKDIYLAGCIEAHRARQLIELNSAAILNIIQHLAIFRRNDLAESLEIIDQDFSFTREILQRYVKQTERIRPSVREGAAYLAQNWRQALARPADAMDMLRAMGAELQAAATADEKQRTRAAMATLLGIDSRQKLDQLRAAIADRQHLLLDRLDPLHHQAEQWTGPAAAEDELTEVADAYQGPTALLSDARMAGGWAALADGLGVAVAAVIGSYLAMANAEQPGQDREDGTVSDDRILQWIARFQREHTGQSPSAFQLCQAFGLNDRQLDYRLRNLQSAGRLDWIVVNRRQGREFVVTG